jgi:hypothetical protein
MTEGLNMRQRRQRRFAFDFSVTSVASCSEIAFAPGYRFTKFTARREPRTDAARIVSALTCLIPKRSKSAIAFDSWPFRSEWSQPGYTVQACDRSFMKRVIQRTWPSRVYQIDEFGQPWVSARIRERGKLCDHFWAILESTGWRRVNRRVLRAARRGR